MHTCIRTQDFGVAEWDEKSVNLVIPDFSTFCIYFLVRYNLLLAYFLSSFLLCFVASCRSLCNTPRPSASLFYCHMKQEVCSKAFSKGIKKCASNRHSTQIAPGKDGHILTIVYGQILTIRPTNGQNLTAGLDTFCRLVHATTSFYGPW